jgi:hypothetical protein
MNTIVLAIGGGSDMITAQVIGRSLQRGPFSVLTSFSPILDAQGRIDVEESVKKYTGQPYRIRGEDREPTSPYVDWQVEWLPDTSLPIFKHIRFVHVYGVLVPPVMFPRAVSGASRTVTNLVQALILPANCPPHVIAVDTGGDCLRGIVPGMGDRDVSHLYDGVVDTRDFDTLRMAQDVFQLEHVRVYVVGPGADGETSAVGLVTARDALKVSDGNSRLIHDGCMDELHEYITPEWVSAPPGSTISNIRSAIKVPPTESIEIYRRGNRLAGTIPAVFLRSYWIIDVSTVQPQQDDDI